MKTLSTGSTGMVSVVPAQGGGVRDWQHCGSLCGSAMVAFLRQRWGSTGR